MGENDNEREYKVEVYVQGEWTSNALRFFTSAEADAYGRDLYGRWTAVVKYRVVYTPTGEVVTEEPS